MALIIHRSSCLFPRPRLIIKAGDYSFESCMPTERERRSRWRDYSQPATVIAEEE